MELPTLLCARSESGPLTADWHAEAWRKVTSVELRETVSGGPPQQATRVRVAWSEVELRVLFHAEDTHAWATLTERDAPLWEEEVVEVRWTTTTRPSRRWEVAAGERAGSRSPQG